MPIENVWPGRKAAGLLRGMYNVAVHRLNPGHPPTRDRDVMKVVTGRQQSWVRLYGSAAPRHHWIRLGPSVAVRLHQAVKEHAAEPVGLLALWRDPSADDRVIHTWLVPAAVVEQMDAQLPAGVDDKRRNLTINKRKGDGRWYWTGAGAVQPIDITDFYTPWNLDENEMAALEGGDPQLGDEAEPVEDGAWDADNDEQNQTLAIGANRIYFGPPGTGKTWNANAFCDGHRNPQKFTTTFHPEYTYYDFVGSYKPVMVYGGKDVTYKFENGDKLPSGTPAVVYRFVPGVFTNALLRAMTHPQETVFLVIDEINRGNCAAIFGDVFQLLDRITEPCAEQGWSRYFVTPDPAIFDYCCSIVDVKLGNQLRATGLRIPNNLSLVATMNTSDQSLFPMDAAFKRRWEWEYVPINYEQEDIQERDVVIRSGANERKIPWVKFLRHVNQRVAIATGSDDKQVGVYFVPLDADVSPARFLNKVLFYLWIDVFRHNPDALFAPGIRSYDDLAQRFLGGQWVFKQDFLHELGEDVADAGGAK